MNYEYVIRVLSDLRIELIEQNTEFTKNITISPMYRKTTKDIIKYNNKKIKELKSAMNILEREK